MAITEFLLFVLTAPECFSLCSYLLSGYTKRDLRSNEATMKYLLMGGASQNSGGWSNQWGGRDPKGGLDQEGGLYKKEVLTNKSGLCKKGGRL